jgi:hypothetical protein
MRASKNNNAEVSTQADQAIRRFPRLPGVRKLAVTAKCLRGRLPLPVVKIVQPQTAIQFTFRVPVPPKIRQLSPNEWEVLFERASQHLETAIGACYETAGTPKRFHEYISDFLLNVCNQGIGTFDRNALAYAHLTSPSFCTKFSERVYITALGCEIAFGTMELQAAGAGGL